jgi:two-component system sensor histidine kinase PilS (NtrC family)
MERAPRQARPRLASLSGLAPPERDPNELETTELSRKMLVVAAIRVAAVTLTLGALVAFGLVPAVPGRTWQYVLIGGVYALVARPTFLSLRRRPLVVPLAYVQVVFDSVIVSLVVLMTGGIESIFSFAYMIVAVEGAILLYRRGAVTALVSDFLMYGTILLIQIDHYWSAMPEVLFGPAIFSFFMHQAGTAAVAFLSSTLAEKAQVSGRRLAEKQSDLEQLEELHAAILRSLPAGLMTVDGSGIVRFANEAAMAILRLPPGNLVGAPLEEISSTMHKAWERRRVSFIGGKNRERFEDGYRRQDGSEIRIGFSFAPLSVGRSTGSIIVFQDVTDIVRLKEAVERAERLATVGKFAAGLAHEVRNPLAAMCASIDVLKVSLSPPESMQRLMTNVVREAERLNGLISDFLLFARPRDLNLRATDLSVLAQSVLDVFRHDALMQGQQVEGRIAPGVSAELDGDLVRQVLWNLVKNAAEAMSKKPGGTLTVQVSAGTDGARVLIADTGQGIPANQLDRIFEPFFTTKERGSGLGLAISHSIMEAHGGQMRIDSREGVGTEVHLLFPPRVEREGPPVPNPEEVTDDVELIGGSVYPEQVAVSRSSSSPPRTANG